MVQLPAGIRRIPAGIISLVQELGCLRVVAQEREMETPQVVTQR